MAARVLLASITAAVCAASELPACAQDDSCEADETQFVQLKNQKFGPWPRPRPRPTPTPAPTPPPPPMIVQCEVYAKGDPANSPVTGTLTFEKSKSKQSFTLIHYDICGLTQGLHGLHVHEKADFSNGCLSTLNHFNPDFNNHSSATDLFKHLGDLGNILVADNGCAKGTNLQSDLPFEKWEKETIFGRSIVVHAGEDDLGQGGDDASRGPAGGNAGGRVACGEIRLAPIPVEPST